MDSRMKRIFDSIDAPAIVAADITIPWAGPWCFISEDRLLCYTGACLKNNPKDPHLESTPYYFEGKHSFDALVEKKTNGFFRLDQGEILLDNFVDKSYDKQQLYKRLSISIVFPRGAETRYRVHCQQAVPKELIENIECEIFGINAEALENFLLGYAKVFGRYNDYFSYPRLTRYQGSDSFCDLCEMWIPPAYPYIIFQESGSDFSHVSIWAACRYFQILLQNRNDSATAKLLIQNGVSPKDIDRVLNVYQSLPCSYQEKKVTRSLFRTLFNEEY